MDAAHPRPQDSEATTGAVLHEPVGHTWAARSRQSRSLSSPLQLSNPRSPFDTITVRISLNPRQAAFYSKLQTMSSRHSLFQNLSGAMLIISRATEQHLTGQQILSYSMQTQWLQHRVTRKRWRIWMQTWRRLCPIPSLSHALAYQGRCNN